MIYFSIFFFIFHSSILFSMESQTPQINDSIKPYIKINKDEFKCSFCEGIFKSSSGAMVHSKTTHHEQFMLTAEHQCSTCKQFLFNKRALKTHQSTEHQHVIVPNIHRNLSALKMKINFINGPIENKSITKKYTFPTSPPWNEIKDGVGKTVFECAQQDCKHIVQSMSGIRNHVKAQHFELLQEYVCTCGTALTTQFAQTHHQCNTKYDNSLTSPNTKKQKITD